MRALEEATAQEKARKEAEERATQEALAQAWADAANTEGIQAALTKVADERAKTEAELRALEAGKSRLQSAHGEEAGRARENAKRTAAEASAAAMKEARRRSSARCPRASPTWTPFERSSPGTPPPG